MINFISLLMISHLALGQLHMYVGGHDYSLVGIGSNKEHGYVEGDPDDWAAAEDARLRAAERERDAKDDAILQQGLRERRESRRAPSIKAKAPKADTSGNRAITQINNRRLNAELPHRRDYAFNTPVSSTEGGKLNQALEKRNIAASAVSENDRRLFLRIADNGLDVADDYYVRKMHDFGDEALAYAEKLIDLATSWTPGVSWGRDLYEAVTGLNAISGETLGSVDRAFAVLGSASMGVGSKMGRGLKVFSEVVTSKTVLNAHTLGEAHKMAKNATNAASDNMPTVRRMIEFLRKNESIGKEDRRKLVQAFGKQSKVTVLQEDMQVYRYWQEGHSHARGRWLTVKQVKDPYIDLALEKPGIYKEAKWTIPKGTEVLEGLVSPNFGQPGGGYQIFLHDAKVLK